MTTRKRWDRVAVLAMMLLTATCALPPAPLPAATSGVALPSATTNPSDGAPLAAEPRAGIDDLSLIADGDVSEIWWEGSDGLLRYALGGVVFEADASTRSVVEVGILPLSAGLASPTPPLLLRSGALDVGFSPSGERALYLIRPNPTPTPGPEDGEVWLRGGEATLWLWTGDSTVALGQVEDCIEDYHWAVDESLVVADAVDAPAPCAGPHAWLVRQTAGEVVPLFPREDFPGSLLVLGLSPDNDQLLYWHQQTISIIDLRTMWSQRLPIAGVVDAQWIGPDRALVLFAAEGSPRREMGVLDTRTGGLTLALGQGADVRPPDRSVVRMLVSPDMIWVAFLLGDDQGRARSLWVGSVSGR